MMLLGYSYFDHWGRHKLFIVFWLAVCKLREFLWVLGIVEGVDWKGNRDVCPDFLQIMPFLQDKRMTGFSFLSRIKGIIFWYREQIKDFFITCLEF